MHGELSGVASSEALSLELLLFCGQKIYYDIDLIYYFISYFRIFLFFLLRCSLFSIMSKFSNIWTDNVGSYLVRFIYSLS